MKQFSITFDETQNKVFDFVSWEYKEGAYRIYVLDNGAPTVIDFPCELYEKCMLPPSEIVFEKPSKLTMQVTIENTGEIITQLLQGLKPSNIKTNVLICSETDGYIANGAWGIREPMASEKVYFKGILEPSQFVKIEEQDNGKTLITIGGKYHYTFKRSSCIKIVKELQDGKWHTMKKPTANFLNDEKITTREKKNQRGGVTAEPLAMQGEYSKFSENHLIGDRKGKWRIVLHKQKNG